MRLKTFTQIMYLSTDLRHFYFGISKCFCFDKRMKGFWIFLISVNLKMQELTPLCSTYWHLNICIMLILRYKWILWLNFPKGIFKQADFIFTQVCIHFTVRTVRSADIIYLCKYTAWNCCKTVKVLHVMFCLSNMRVPLLYQSPIHYETCYSSTGFDTTPLKQYSIWICYRVLGLTDIRLL